MEQLFQNKKEENVGTARMHMKCRSFSEKNLISSGQNWLKIYKFLQMNLPFILFTLKIAEKRREVKGKGEKERYTHLNAEPQKIARRDKKGFLSEQWKETKTTEWESLEISSRKLEMPREHFLQRWAQ